MRSLPFGLLGRELGIWPPDVLHRLPIRHRATRARYETDELQRLEAVKFYRSYEAGWPIICSRDRMEVLVSLVEGVATMSRAMEDGRRQMVGLLLPSDFIGRPGEVAPHDVVAVTDLTLCCFRRRPFEELLIDVPHPISKALLPASPAILSRPV